MAQAQVAEAVAPISGAELGQQLEQCSDSRGGAGSATDKQQFGTEAGMASAEATGAGERGRGNSGGSGRTPRLAEAGRRSYVQRPYISLYIL